MTLRGFAKRMVIVSVFTLSGMPAWAQDIDLNNEILTTLESGLTLSGAPHAPLSVVVADEGDLFLVFEKDGDVIWSLRFPTEELVNSPKGWVTTSGDTIRTFSEFPFSSARTIQTFLWTGTGLELLDIDSRDPSYEAVKKAIEWTAAGKALPDDHLEAVGYPDRYVYDALIINAIVKSHQTAMDIYKNGKPGIAATRLASMFELTRALIGLVGLVAETDRVPDDWIETWQELGIAGKDFIYALNDYGFFLQEAGEHSSATVVFNKIIELDPKRIVVFLNLADSQWELGNTENAKKQYRSYVDLMAAAGLFARIPARVKQRIQ